MPPSIPQTSGIYKIVCSVTGKIYIGSSINLWQRKIAHWRDLRGRAHHSRHLQRAWDKYGEVAFVFEVLELVLSPFLIEREQYWLDKLRPYDHRRGFNISPTAGSCSGIKRSDEVRQMMSEREQTRWSDPEQRRRSGLRSGWGVDGWSEATLAARALGLKKRKSQVGRKFSPETVAKWVETRSRWCVVTDPDGQEHRVRNLAAFSREHGLGEGSLSAVARGECKQVRGWTCRYADDQDEE